MKRLITCLLSSVALMAGAREYVITDFGVVPDSTVCATGAIQQVIDRASLEGGGTIVIPKGTFLTGALFFKPHTRLKLLEGAVLKGSDQIADYPLIPSRMEGKRQYYYAALINAYEVNRFSITGPGLINGNGERFWKHFWAYRDSMRRIGKEATNLEVSRPRLIFLWGCDSVVISGVKLWNSGFWTTHLYECNDALIENCDIRSPYKPVPAPSTDGIDLDVCQRVIVRGCYIAVNDDAIAIKGGKGPKAHLDPENGPVEDVLIEQCSFGPSHACVTMGSECVHARNIRVKDCTVNTSCPLLRLKMRPDTYQLYEQISLELISGTCSSVIDMNPWKQFFNLEGAKEQLKGTVRDISFSDLNLTCDRFGVMQGNPQDTVSNISFQNVRLQAKDPVLKTKYQVQFKHVTVNGVRQDH